MQNCMQKHHNGGECWECQVNLKSFIAATYDPNDVGHNESNNMGTIFANRFCELNILCKTALNDLYVLCERD